MKGEWKMQKTVNELLICTDLQTTQRENTMFNDKMSSLEDQVRLLVTGLSQREHIQPQTQTISRVLYGRDAVNIGCSIKGSSRGDSFAADPSYHRSSSQVNKYSQYVGSSRTLGMMMTPTEMMMLIVMMTMSTTIMRL